MTQVAIQLPDDLSHFVNQSVKAGDFHNRNEFFVSVVSMYKDQIETRLSEADEAKLNALRGDIQIAVDQAESGEIIRDFRMEDLLAELHSETVVSGNA